MIELAVACIKKIQQKAKIQKRLPAFMKIPISRDELPSILESNAQNNLAKSLSIKNVIVNIYENGLGSLRKNYETTYRE